MTVAWFDELNLDPEAHPVAMGTRSLGDRPWLIVDEKRDVELALKADLLATKRDRVLHLNDDSIEAAQTLAELIRDDLQPVFASTAHPLEAAALAVQDDLCLLRRRSDGWHLDASCLCFPTRWHLLEKVGKHIADVHGPVNGYDPLITAKVDRLFDRLTPQPVWRRNWFLMTDPTLHQPDRPSPEPIVSRSDVGGSLYIRSERQTLRRLSDDWLVFTIRIQQEPLEVLLTDDARTTAFAKWVEHVSDEFGRRRHLTAPQRTELLGTLR